MSNHTKVYEVGSRVRTAVDWRAPGFKLGTVVSLSGGPWVKVAWDEGRESRHQTKELVPAEAPYVLHYHRCEWCGVLMKCTDSCGGRLNRFDPYDPEEFESNGKVLPGGHCDKDCYSHRRPRGAQHNMTEDGCPVTFPTF